LAHATGCRYLSIINIIITIVFIFTTTPHICRIILKVLVVADFI
jgi:hypothetical protein